MEEIFEKKPVKIVEIPLMTAGLCGYGDSGNVYISDSTMYQIMPKLLGISVIITHQGQEAVGEVVEVFQNPGDTDQWIGKLSVRTEEARSLLEEGWGVSTAYRIVRDTGVSGKWNNIDYTTEVQDVDWLHVAIVENPRYTIAKDGYFLNSKNDSIVYSQIVKEERKKPMFNLFKTKKEKINLNEDEKIYVKLGEEDVELKDLIEMVKEKEEEKKKYAEDDMIIELNGESLTVKELVEKYNACGKKNEEEKEEVEIKEEKENACGKKNEDEDKKDDEDKKENEEEKIEEEKKEEIKEDEEDKKEDEDKKENEEDKKEDEGKKEIKNSIDLRTAYINRGSDVAIRHDYLTTKERMELAHKKYGSDK